MRVVRAGASWAVSAAAVIARLLDDALALRPRASWAVSGGRTPAPVFAELRGATIDWARVDVFQVDERVAPLGDPARNLTDLQSLLLDHVPATVHPMPVNETNLDRAAADYGALLPETLDVVHLGLGGDGHTASLVPEDPVLRVTDRSVAVTGVYAGHRRMTLTFPALNAAASRVWIVGGGKGSMLARLLAADSTIPAGRITHRRSVLVTGDAGDDPKL
ncbi:MAG: 6-phosphogluconolactonase [Myxococcota bacterium]